jgi:hypothetical protein
VLQHTPCRAPSAEDHPRTIPTSPTPKEPIMGCTALIATQPKPCAKALHNTGSTEQQRKWLCKPVQKHRLPHSHGCGHQSQHSTITNLVFQVFSSTAPLPISCFTLLQYSPIINLVFQVLPLHCSHSYFLFQVPSLVQLNPAEAVCDQ